MSIQLKLRRGTTAQHSTFTGAAGEVTVDTDKKTLVVHDGATPGGNPVLPAVNPSYTGTLTGGTGVVNLGSGQFYKDASGNVGIGTSSFASSAKLQVAGGRSYFGSNDSVYAVHVAYNNTRALAGQGYYIGGTDSATPSLVFSNNDGTERMRIDTSGNVGIGTSAVSSWGEKLNVTTGNSATANFNSSAANGGYAVWSNNGTTYGFIGTATGILGSGGTNALALRSEGALYFGAGGSTERARIDTTGQFYTKDGPGAVRAAYDCRAWVNFNGTGTVTIRAAANVSSITDNGVGDYTVNFTNAMSNSSYASTVSTTLAYGAAWLLATLNTGAAGTEQVNSTTAMRIATTSSGGGANDSKYVSYAAFQ